MEQAEHWSELRMPEIRNWRIIRNSKSGFIDF